MTETKPQRTIPRTDWFALHGLFHLAREHQSALRTIERAAGEIVGEPDDEYGYYGYVSDQIWSDNSDANELLRLMKIEVSDG